MVNNTYNKLLMKEIIDVRVEIDEIYHELEPARQLIDTFKLTEEQSLKKIYELNIKYSMAQEDRRQDKIAFDKRINTLIRDFVKIFKNLSNEFRLFKEFTMFE